MTNTRTEAATEVPTTTDQSPKPQILIGISGYRHSGKNTAAKYIAEWGNRRGLITVERGFAELLKLSAARSLGLATNLNDAVVLMDCLKENGEITIAIPEQSLLRTITGREYLKWYGTEGHRDVFGFDFWLDQVLPTGFTDYGTTWQDAFTMFEDDPEIQPNICILTDVRFVNEAQRIKDLGGKIWRIERGLRPDDHISEQPLPDEIIDTTILNYSSLEAFESEVRTQMTTEYQMRSVEGTNYE